MRIHYKEKKRWALPFDGDTHILFYRKSLLAKHNLAPPETWDDFLYVSRTITEKEKTNGIYGSAIMAYKVPVLILSSFLNRVGAYGGQLLTPDGKPSLDTPEVLAALTALVEHSKYALPSPLETSFEVSRDAFLSGRVAMVEQWTDLGVMAEDSSESTIRGDWGAIQMPKGIGKKARHAPALNAGYALGISSKAPNLELAKEFLLFATRPDIMAKYNVINGGTDPTRISVLTSEDYRKFAPLVRDAAQAAIENATPWTNVPESTELMEVLTENLVLVLQNRISPKEALLKTQKSWTEILLQSK
ncbi:MAG: extracellular solute-binding protein [Leptospiraceae bacterium]|nr:extracellular solute-binding protein [Leptospiraceae bacterium]